MFYIKGLIIIIVVFIGIFLYQKQLGAITFFLLSFYFLYLAIRQYQKNKE
ncbi:hypothetical protein [Bacillus coahuilensis]|nr:hypothetical protein [Bacillus coahuilensis]